MKIRNVVLAIALGCALTGAANAQVISYSPRTGDIWIDTQLGYMNDYGRSDRDYFIDDIVNSFGAPRYLVNDLMVTRRWSPGDVYYACALAYHTHHPCGDVVRVYEQNRGQGWGVVAMRMGIKPGSAEFHALKGRVGKSNGKFKLKSGSGFDGPGKSGKSKGYGDHDHNDGPGISAAGKGKADGGPGKSGKGNSDKDKGKGGKDKGKGH